MPSCPWSFPGTPSQSLVCRWLSSDCFDPNNPLSSYSSDCFTCQNPSATRLEILTQTILSHHIPVASCFNLSPLLWWVKSFSVFLLLLFLTHHPYCDGSNPFLCFSIQAQIISKPYRKYLDWLCVSVKGKKYWNYF